MPGDKTSIETVRYALDTAFDPTTVTENSVNDYVHRGRGHIVSKEITLSVNNGTQSLNVFQLTGTCEVMRLYAFVTDATTFTNCTAAFFELDDGAAQVAITKNDGVLSGMAVGTYMAKNALNTVTMAIANNATGVVTEQAADKRAFQTFIITQKTGQNTYVRFTYTSTDTPVDAKITVYAEYQNAAGGTLVAV
jgi:hypothetical protein